ncbi:MAG: hypothetical protein KAS90_00880 [Candidatus Aenigmarchaeota archaeon]|nr:hypothetical protein [Candidatus Aenigmarchaeota archaeon]
MKKKVNLGKHTKKKEDKEESREGYIKQKGSVEQGKNPLSFVNDKLIIRLITLIVGIITLIGVIIGVIVGGLAIWNYLNPPSIEVIDWTPILIYNEKEVLNVFNNVSETIFEEGIGFVVHVQTESRPVNLKCLEITGEMLLTPNEYLFFASDDVVGRVIDEIGEEWKEKEPYTSVKWTAWSIDDEELKGPSYKHIRFILMEPMIYGQREIGYEMPVYDYVGFLDGSKEAAMISGYSNVDFVFRDGIKTGKIELFLRVGIKQVQLPYSKMKPIKSYSKEEWESESFEKHFLKGDIRVK